MMFNTLAALLPFLATAQAFFILSHPILATTRLDPIVSPGSVSGHVHSIAGGNNFDKAMTFESARASTCTTAVVTEDKSNYWTPQLYYYSPKDQTYTAIPVGVVNTYYLPRGGKDGKVRAFPDGLRMVVGNPNRRSFNNDADSKAISFVCLEYSGEHRGDPEWAQRNNFFKHNCPNGMRAQVFFKSCWDGVNLDSPDHSSHMAWPSGGVDGGECPASHPVRLVSLFYEFIYNVQDFPFNDPEYPTWVFANGDTTGYGMHGDFLNGWPAYNNGTNILQQAIDGCNQNNGVGGNLQDCPPFVPFLNSASARACGPRNLLVNEDVGYGGGLKSLPGNNPIWIGNGTKPSYANYTETSTNFTDFKSVIPEGYSETGCMAEGTTGRALNALYWSSSNMTRGACVSYCADNGFPLAGIQYGKECRCDSAIRNGASNTTLVDANRCSMRCAGNDYENCGGSSVMNLYNNPAMYKTKPLPAGWTSTGCYSEPSGSRAISGYSFSSQSMTQELCIKTCASRGYTLAGAEWSQECYCGNKINSASAQVSDNQCDMPCKGDLTTTCGGSSRLTVFTFSNVTTTSVAATSSAVVNATTSVNATTAVSTSTTANVTSVSTASTQANATTVVSSTAANSTVTAVSSVAAVNSTSAAASSAVTLSASAVNSTSAVVLIADKSVAPSSAVSSAVATSSVAPVASSTSVAPAASSAAAAPALPSGWTSQGCVSEATGMRALIGYSSNWAQMTTGACLAACQSRGYKYAGLEYGRECYCGDGINAGSGPVPDSTCNVKCGGDSSTMCGGASRLNLYVSSIEREQPDLPESWSSTGCYTELSSGRTLRSDNFSSADKMTVELCIQTAISKGYSYAGLQKGKECWMANSIATNSVKVEDWKCSSTCTGDLTGRCGGSGLLSIYNTSEEPVTEAAAPVSASNSTASSASATATKQAKREVRRSRQ